MKRLATGFTLIEILVVSTIIVLLAGLSINSYTQFNKQARDAKRKADAENIRAAIEMFKSNDSTYNSYPASLPSLTPYLRATPYDPKSTPYPTWVKSPSNCTGLSTSAVCTNYTLTIPLESGGNYVCNNLGCQ